MGDTDTDSGSWVRTAKDLVSGAAGGIAQVLLGGPCFSLLRCQNLVSPMPFISNSVVAVTMISPLPEACPIFVM